MTGIDPETVTICVGEEQTFHAQGTAIVQAVWATSPPGDPAVGTGPSFTTKWNTTGLSGTVTAMCNQTSASAIVDVVAVERIIVDGSNPEDEGPVTINNGTSIVLRAKRTPPPVTGPWPASRPVWDVTPPTPFTGYDLEPDPADAGKATFIPKLLPQETTPASFKVKATCGASSDEFTVLVERCAIEVTDVTADERYERVDDTGSVFNVVGARGEGEDRVTLTIAIDPDTPENRQAISWEGAAVVTIDPNDPDFAIKATVAINESVRKDVVIKFNGEPCQEIRVWPVWATMGNFRGDNAQGEDLSPENNPAAPLPCPGLGTPPTCTGDPTPELNGTFNQMELRATISPPGVSALAGTGTSVQFDFKRTLERKEWVKNANDAQWTLLGEVPAGTGDDPNNGDEDLHDQNDVIWVIDTPGVQEGDATHDLRALEWQFIETVELILNKPSNVLQPKEGPLISEQFPWYSILNLKKDPATGKWVRNTDRRNEIKAGTISIGNQPQ